jgi:hypothetical protein
MAPKVDILILNWNNWPDTVECLESVLQSSYPDYQVVVIDNASTDGSMERISEWAEGKLRPQSGFFEYAPQNKPVPYIIYDRETAESGGRAERERPLYLSLLPPVHHPLVLIQTGSNLGYAGGNNAGIRYALGKGDAAYLWLLNNDTVVGKTALEEMVRCLEDGPSLAMAGSKLLYYHSPGVLHMAGGGRIVPWMGNASMIGANEKDDGRWDRALSPDYISGASLLVRTEALRAIGLMREDFFLYWEDADWGERARRTGHGLAYCPRSRVWHKEGGTSGGITPLTDYYWVRNGLMFTRRYHPWLLPLVFLSYLAKYTLVRLLKGQPHHLGAFFRGVLDFLGGRSGKRP